MNRSASPRAVTWVVLGLGFLFLYLPILSLIVFSFNESRLVTVWGGFSTKWYGAVFRDQGLTGAAWVSLRVATYTATAATILGTLAALVTTRFRRFRGKTLFTGLMTAPLVMPEVITGVSILMMFVAMGQMLAHPIERGIMTVWIAHVTLTMAFVTVVVSSRLSEMDKSLEEAAMDLGAHRVTVFFSVTLPLLIPALLSGWLLAFTLSLDDLVIASFVNGPGSTTLPQKVFSSVRMGLSPKINALATLMIVVVSFAATLATVLALRAEARRKRELHLAFVE